MEPRWAKAVRPTGTFPPRSALKHPMDAILEQDIAPPVWAIHANDGPIRRAHRFIALAQVAACQFASAAGNVHPDRAAVELAAFELDGGRRCLDEEPGLAKPIFPTALGPNPI